MQKVVNINQAKSLQIQWHTLIGVAVFHALAVAALFTFSWTNLAAAVVAWWVANSLGIGVGYHRLLTHRGFKTPKWFEYLLTLCGMLALQSGALSWVTTHRLHHAFTETDKDPHSPIKGLYWAHIGWIFQGVGQNQTDATMMRYTPDMMKDGVHRFLNKYYWVAAVALGIAVFAVGGWSMLFWVMGLRTVFGWHTTWLVNSATHTWGTRRFETRDTSTNSLAIALLTFGEGWHNNHHAIPRSSRHGLTWKEIDINWFQLRVFEKLGLVRELYAYDLKAEDGTAELRKAA
ncbi:MAG: fatty acid desaturase [Acidobacteria bacterium]|nr:fatty acid desaturase [Acidobacteriota bacterium]